MRAGMFTKSGDLRRALRYWEAVLADRELMQLLLPVVRDDFALVHDYRYRTAARLPLPLTVLAGRKDLAVPAELVPPWADEAGAGCEVHWFDGGHFFVDSARAAVVDCIRRQLTSLTGPALPRAPGSWARPLESHG